MWDVETTVGGTLEGTEDTVTGGGSDETNIEDGEEWSSVFVGVFFDVVFGAIDLLVALVQLVHAELFQQSTGEEETSGVGGGVVGETSGETVLLQFGGVCLGEDSITLDGGVHDLGDDLGICSSDHESVLWSVVLITVLDDHVSTSIVVGLSFSSSSELGLESFEIWFCLSDLDECHWTLRVC